MDQDAYFPPAGPSEWERVSAAEAGWDEAGLADVARYCEADGASQLVILRGGRLLLERCWHGAVPATTTDVASVQKAVVCLLLGMTWGGRRIDLDEPVSRWLGPGWSRAPRQAEESILVRHLTTMSSGLYDDFTVESPPGCCWYYNNNAYHQLRHVLERAAGAGTQDLFRRRLTSPVGLQGARWVQRPRMKDPNGRVLSGLHASARDLARVGLLVLARGRWEGTAVLDDDDFLDTALTPSQPLNPAYGHLWWVPVAPWAILPGGDRPDPRKSFGGYRLDHPITPQAPSDLRAAFGAGGARLYLSASLDLVVSRLGGPPGEPARGRPFDAGLWARIMTAAGAA